MNQRKTNNFFFAFTGFTFTKGKAFFGWAYKALRFIFKMNVKPRGRPAAGLF